MSTRKPADRGTDPTQQPETDRQALQLQQKRATQHLRLRGIGGRIRFRRRALELSQGELAKRAGMSRSRIYELESQVKPHNMTVIALFQIADALDCHVADLLDDRDH